MSTSEAGAEKFVLASSGTCLYHCTGRTRPYALASARGPIGWAYTCPGGTVSTVAFLGGARRPSPARIRRYLQARTERTERVKARDLRSATRHGPELGAAAERWVAGPGKQAPIHLLYWRRYPRKVGRRYSFLYACFAHGPGEVRFYTASTSRRASQCPFCRAKV
jgi:hypothetical protein